jgi:Uri superfamily endonuclease
MPPAEPGTYVLLLRCSSTRAVHVGRLGTLRLRPGWYVHVGSAYGPRGLRARISHHRHRVQRPHWPIDYLRR